MHPAMSREYPANSSKQMTSLRLTIILSKMKALVTSIIVKAAVTAICMMLKTDGAYNWTNRSGLNVAVR